MLLERGHPDGHVFPAPHLAKPGWFDQAMCEAGRVQACDLQGGRHGD